jgi:hypothetical protein
MDTTIQSTRNSGRRILLVSVSTFLVVLLAGTVLLWAQLGTAVFFELIAAGIRYCF